MRFTQFPETPLRFRLVMDTGKLITLANGTVAVILANTATVFARQVQLGGTRRLSAKPAMALAPRAAWTRQLRQGDRIVRNARSRLNRSSSCS
jgi:hypothetical protein